MAQLGVRRRSAREWLDRLKNDVLLVISSGQWEGSTADWDDRFVLGTMDEAPACPACGRKSLMMYRYRIRSMIGCSYCWSLIAAVYSSLSRF